MEQCWAPRLTVRPTQAQTRIKTLGDEQLLLHAIPIVVPCRITEKHGCHAAHDPASQPRHNNHRGEKPPHPQSSAMFSSSFACRTGDAYTESTLALPLTLLAAERIQRADANSQATKEFMAKMNILHSVNNRTHE